ncbi:hypothetical protein N9E56_02830 [Flavobacteriaceae bacterium]|nr:hypothetical protein [Flavobacteriaceae bacterium]
MKSNKVIEQIKNVLNLNEEVKLEQMKLDNGTVIEADSFESGVEVFIVTEDEKVALPIGEYSLEDGKLLVVTEEGVISEIKETEEEVEETEEEEIEVEAAEEEVEFATKEELAEVKSMIEEIKAMLEPKEDLSEEVGNLLTEELSKHELSLEKELASPSAAPIVSNPEAKKTISKFSVSKNRKSTTIDRVMNRLNN